jgi:ribonucleotide monophosphatase NagD (HAD superfamily)
MKPKTFIIDIDGVIIKHLGAGAHAQWEQLFPVLLPGTIDFLTTAEAKSSCIILMTARPECCREDLVKQLRLHGVFWDQLIMGVSHGTRVLINDIKPPGVQSAVAINLPRNEGLASCIELV